MEKTTPRALRALALVFAIGIAFVGCSSSSNLAPRGDNTYVITRQAGTGISRNTAALKEEALKEATKFCDKEGKQLKVVSVNEEKPPFPTAGYARVTVVFKALNAGDPELSAAPAMAASSDTYVNQSVTRSAPIASTPTDDLYNELTKLDDLRKKGILTDEEFQAEKKKVLNRAR